MIREAIILLHTLIKIHHCDASHGSVPCGQITIGALENGHPTVAGTPC